VQRYGKPQQNAVTVDCNLHFQRVVKDSCSLVNSVWPLLIKEEVSVFGLRVRKQPSLSTSVCLPHLPTGLYCVLRSSGCKINGRQQVHSLASAPELHSIKMGVQECLQNIYSSMGLQDWARHEHITVSGTQTLMGMEGEWCLNWNMDGRFFEQFDGIEMTMEWAYDGEDEPWGGDAAGRVTIMDLDDREVFFFSHCFQLNSFPFLMSPFLDMKRRHSVCFCFQEGPILVLASSAKCMAWTYVSLMIS
jgi:hypothetical protein